jgi:RNA polymerase sigma-70 factor (ECF subfamily)
MSIEEGSFAEWMRRVRAGDAAAAEELVRKYESAVRVAVRIRLTDPALRRQFDSVDVCQSVLASFFLRAAAGQFDLEDPSQLVALLVKMAQNKFGMQARRLFRQRRDARRDVPNGDNTPEIAADEPGPEQHAIGRDMVRALYDRLSPEERALAERRGQGKTWAEIADELGGTAQARRKQLARAIDRVAPDLGLDDPPDADEGGDD